MTLFEEKRPRYQRVAEALSESIRRGDYPVGTMLPSEAELCAQFGTSRQPIREALRLLVEIGLVSRHHGVGTRVRRDGVAREYVQRLENVADIWQYVKETRRVVLRVADVAAAQARVALPGDPTRRWRMLEGLRFVPDSRAPVAWTQVYVAPEYAAVTDAKQRDRVPIFSLIEKRFGVRADQIRQEIAAVSIDRAVARRLHVPANSVGLSVMREYVSTDGDTFEVTLSVHPADRYRYTMRLDLAYPTPVPLAAPRRRRPTTA